MLAELKSAAKRSWLRLRNNTLSIGRRTTVTRVNFGRHVDLANDVVILDSSIGDYTYIGPRTTIAASYIGRYCSIAPEVTVGSGSHPSRGTISSHPIFYLSRPKRGWDFVEDDRVEFKETKIGNDVWLAAKVVVKDGVTIGDGVIVGAGAVVVNNLKPYGIYGGVPARLIRLRFPEDFIDKLLAFRWWDRDAAWVRQHADLFNDVEAFGLLMAHEANAS